MSKQTSIAWLTLCLLAAPCAAGAAGKNSAGFVLAGAKGSCSACPAHKKKQAAKTKKKDSCCAQKDAGCSHSEAPQAAPDPDKKRT